MIESVVAVFICRKEIFYFQRQLTLKAFPGYHAFPGGKIDRNESETPFKTGYLNEYPPRIMRALCRELQEELNFDLEDAIRYNDVKNFEYIGLAKPPVSAIGKFVAHHFKITLNKKIQFRTNREEALDSGWIPVEKLWELYSLGRVLAVIPTRRVIEELAKDITTVKIDPLNVTCDPEKEVPVLELVKGLYFLFILSQKGENPRYSNAVILGDPAYIIDPLPCSPGELEKLVFSLKPFRLEGIVITHHQEDLLNNTDKLAKKLKLKIRCSSVTRDHIINSFGSSYFDNIDFRELRECETLTQWLGQRVMAYNLPGSDEGQIGLAPENLAWFHVGDLIRTSGWRITGPQHFDKPGKRVTYRKSIQRVIGMDPSIIIPSYGMPLGSTHYLMKTVETMFDDHKTI